MNSAKRALNTVYSNGLHFTYGFSTCVNRSSTCLQHHTDIYWRPPSWRLITRRETGFLTIGTIFTWRRSLPESLSIHWRQGTGQPNILVFAAPMVGHRYAKVIVVGRATFSIRLILKDIFPSVAQR